MHCKAAPTAPPAPTSSTVFPPGRHKASRSATLSRSGTSTGLHRAAESRSAHVKSHPRPGLYQATRCQSPREAPAERLATGRRRVPAQPWQPRHHGRLFQSPRSRTDHRRRFSNSSKCICSSGTLLAQILPFMFLPRYIWPPAYSSVSEILASAITSHCKIRDCCQNAALNQQRLPICHFSASIYTIPPNTKDLLSSYIQADLDFSNCSIKIVKRNPYIMFVFLVWKTQMASVASVRSNLPMAGNPCLSFKTYRTETHFCKYHVQISLRFLTSRRQIYVGWGNDTNQKTQRGEIIFVSQD